jgi:hypothetical protein
MAGYEDLDPTHLRAIGNAIAGEIYHGGLSWTDGLRSEILRAVLDALKAKGVSESAIGSMLGLAINRLG